MLKLHETIAIYRKKLGWTQEELASKLGVTGQSVSKWESGICCPDIQLLPAIADLFDVDLDTLMGHVPAQKSPESFRDMAYQVRDYLANLPADHLFRDSFRLAVILHEILSTEGYRKQVPWDADASFEKTVSEEEPRRWGTSITSLPDGTTVYSGSGIFIGYNGTWQPPAPADIHRLASSLRRLAHTDLLCVLFALHSLTCRDFDLYVTAGQIAEKAAISLERTDALLDNLPLTIQRDNEGVFRYRLEGGYMHVLSLLCMGSHPDMPSFDIR